MGWIDSHCHLADPRLDSEREAWITEAEKLGIGFFMQGGVGPEDWLRQVDLAKRHPKKIGLCFGLHPYWVIEHSQDECETALDQLARWLPQGMAVGEMGLDFRPHLMKETDEKQIGVFECQIELAEMVHKPMVLHIVQAHDTVWRIFNYWGVPARGGLVHSFNGTWGQAEEYLKRGLYLSIGGPVARAKNQKLKEVVRRMPLEYLLLETDSPDQPPDFYQGQMNPLASLWEVAKTVAEIRHLDALDILRISKSNFQRLMKMESEMEGEV